MNTSTTANANAGLCRTCEHRSDCCFQRPGEGPRMQCEEFDPGSPPASRPQRQATAGGDRAASAEDGGGEPLGLCQNCRLRPTCRHPRPEGGVWYCEEYEVE